MIACSCARVGSYVELIGREGNIMEVTLKCCPCSDVFFPRNNDIGILLRSSAQQLSFLKGQLVHFVLNSQNEFFS